TQPPPPPPSLAPPPIGSPPPRPPAPRKERPELPDTPVQPRSSPSWGTVRHISRTSCDASPEGVGRISRRPNGTPQPNFYNRSYRGGEDRTLDTLLKRQVLYH